MKFSWDVDLSLGFNFKSPENAERSLHHGSEAESRKFFFFRVSIIGKSAWFATTATPTSSSESLNQPSTETSCLVIYSLFIRGCSIPYKKIHRSLLRSPQFRGMLWPIPSEKKTKTNFWKTSFWKRIFQLSGVLQHTCWGSTQSALGDWRSNQITSIVG